ncbi:hypothetical protein GQ457_03G029800 [Hibiscus cannabinus]
MNSVITGNIRPTFFPGQLNKNSAHCLLRVRPFSTAVFRRNLTSEIRVFSTTFAETKPTAPVAVEKEDSGGATGLACPICYDPLARISDSPLYVLFFFYLTCLLFVGIFFITRTPVISFLYERGWRQNFVFSGFPGPEKEFDMAKNYLKPVLGGNIVDASCGSGMFTRLFAKSGLFSHVIAVDYSENMLRQCYEFIEEENNFPKEKVTLVRADISRLPFESSSVDAVHAGAALHCWPSPSIAVAEISRVLQPGGVFVATTYILDGPFAFLPFLRTFRENIMGISGSQIFLSERELEDLCRACGLVGFTCIRNGLFVMISARKRSS